MTTDQQIIAIAIEGFKSLRDETRLEIRPLTILAGANNAGKSSAMQPLLLLKQTLEASAEPPMLRLNGDNARFTSSKQFLSRMPSKQQATEFSVAFEVENEKNTLIYGQSADKGIDTVTWIHQPNMSEGQTINFHAGLSDSEIRERIRLYHPDDSSPLMDQAAWKIVARRGFLELGDAENEPGFLAARWLFVPMFMSGLNAFRGWIRHLIHLSGFRGNPQREYQYRQYPFQVEEPPWGFPGLFERYAASLVYQWQRQEYMRLEELVDALGRLGLGWGMKAEPVSDVHLNLLVGQSPKSDESDFLNIADMGIGVRYVLPVLVALLVAEPGQPVYLEHPEMHLHPKAQWLLAKPIADAAKRSVQVIVETHSELILLGIQTLIANGQFKPDDMIIHWFHRQKNGSTQVEDVRLNERGISENKKWPVDFSNVVMKAQKEFLTAQW